MSCKRAMILLMIISALFLSALAYLRNEINRLETDSLQALVFNIYNGEILAAQSEQDLIVARPLGSLPKPLVAYALLSSGKNSDSIFYCDSSSPGDRSTKSCWYKPGHGNLTFVQALAQSCNSWFRQWLRGADSEPAQNLLEKFGVLRPEELSTDIDILEALCGLDGNLSMSSLNCAAGFATLYNGGIVFSIFATENGVRINPINTMEIEITARDLVAAGMRESCVGGTGSAFGKVLGSDSALVKTGTAYAGISGEIDDSRTDGWCIALYPAKSPQYLVLAHLPNSSGAQAAEEAAHFLKSTLEITK